MRLAIVLLGLAGLLPTLPAGPRAVGKRRAFASNRMTALTISGHSGRTPPIGTTGDPRRSAATLATIGVEFERREAVIDRPGDAAPAFALERFRGNILPTW